MSASTLRLGAGGFEDGRGQGAKLLGKNSRTDGSGGLSLHTVLEGSWAAGWDGTNLGQAALAAGKSIHCCKGS